MAHNRLRIAAVLVLSLGFHSAFADVDPDYEAAKGVKGNCPSVGEQDDTWKFVTCNCTSYVAYRTLQDWARIYSPTSIFHNTYFFSDLSEADQLALSPLKRWSDAKYWGDIAKKLGAYRTSPYIGMAAWWGENDIGGGHGHIAEVVDVGSFQDSRQQVHQGVRVAEYNYDPRLQFKTRWIAVTDTEHYPRGFIDLIDLEYRRLVVNKRNHPEMFQNDDYCRWYTNDPKVERFRTHDGGLLRTLVKQTLIDTPEDRIWYYGPSCKPQLSTQLSQLQYENMVQIIADGKGGSGDDSGGGNGNSPLNLGVDFDIMSLSGSELVAGKVSLVKGSPIDLRAKVSANGADTKDWMVRGKDTIEVDYFVRIGNGEWAKISRQHIKAENLPKGETKTETVRYTVPDTGGQTISFRVKIDAEGEAVESNENDNESRVETFTVKNQLDVNLIVPWARLTNGRTSLTGGECYGLEAVTKNIGSDTPITGTRLSYQVFYGNEWHEFDSDAVEAGEMIPGHEQYEKISDESCVKATEVPGIYKFRVYADGPNSIVETNEGDNFFEFPVEVKARPLPDLSILWAKLTNGRTFLTQGECYGIEAVGKNIGGVRPNADTRMSYQIYDNGWRQIADDGVEKEIMNPNQEHWEYISNDGCVGAPNVVGWYRFRACHDAPNAIAEGNEQNNCTEFSAEVRAKPMPNLIVTAIGFTDGLVHKAKSKAHPYFWVCNVGNGPVRADFRSTYYRHGTAVDSDGTEAGLLGPGQCTYEEISGDSFQVPSNPGWYELKVILDTTASEAESNEGDNIATVWFQVVKK